MGSKKTILVVGVRTGELKIIAELLSTDLCAVEWVESGKEAITKALLIAPNMICVQSELLDMSGLELCEKIKGLERFQFTPLIFITKNATSCDKLKALELGAIDCIDLPIHLEEFVAKVKRHLKLADQYLNLYKKNRKLNEQFSNTFEHASAGITHADIDTGQFLKVNQTMCRYLGFSETELLDKSFHDVTHPDFAESDKKNLLELKAGKISSYSKDKQYVRKDGSLVWGRVTVSLAQYADKMVKDHIVAVIIDISARKTVEEINYKLHGVMERSPNVIMITSQSGEIEYANPAFEKVTGYSEFDVVGKLPRVLQSRFHEGNIHKQIWDTIRKGKSWKGEFKNHKKNGEIFWQHITIDPMLSHNNQITNYIVIAEDISEEVQMFEELRLAKQKAEESDRLKSAFLASISHEIRTPLNSIIGFSELIAKSINNDELHEYSNIIKIQNDLLLQLIEDMLEFSSMEAGAIEIQNKEFDMSVIMREMTHLFSEKCPEGVEFRMNTPTHEIDLILSDKNRIQQILLNLISNALKFTKSGFVEYGYTHTEENELVLYVKDTGIGISKEQQQEIFESFTKLDSFSQGTGLGLSIVKNVVEMFNGCIELESELGKGSTFTITIPLKQKTVKHLQVDHLEYDPDRLHHPFGKNNEAC